MVVMVHAINLMSNYYFFLLFVCFPQLSISLLIKIKNCQNAYMSFYRSMVFIIKIDVYTGNPLNNMVSPVNWVLFSQGSRKDVAYFPATQHFLNGVSLYLCTYVCVHRTTQQNFVFYFLLCSHNILFVIGLLLYSR